MNLIGRDGEEGKVKRRYNIQRPLGRVLGLEVVEERIKARLIQLRNSIDIVRLSEEIEAFTESLSITYKRNSGG